MTTTAPEPDHVDRWELTQVGQKLHWPGLVDHWHSVCGRDLQPRRTDDHIATFGSPMPHKRCERCLQLAPIEALEAPNP